MRAHLVQLDIAWENRPANLQRVNRLLRSVPIAAGDLILLPEMFDTGFSMNTALTIDREEQTLTAMRDLARTYRAFVQFGRTIGGGDGGLALNVMTTVGPDGAVLAEYAKMRLFPLGAEARAIAPGRAVTTWLWGSPGAGGEGTTNQPPAPPSGRGGFRVCPLICYDLRFPELFREGLRRGAEVYALGACWLQGRHEHWKPLLAARAIENQAFVLGVNRVGADPNSRYLGGSIALDPRGGVLGELADQEGVLSVEVDRARLDQWREIFPAWREVG